MRDIHILNSIPQKNWFQYTHLTSQTYTVNIPHELGKQAISFCIDTQIHKHITPEIEPKIYHRGF